MTMRQTAVVLAALWAAATAAGCLFRAAEPPRFYRPASAALDDDADERPAPRGGAPIRLGAVRSAPFLRERIVWRASQVEYGLYEQRRWFELPSRYVRRALMGALQETPGLRVDGSTSAARLDVEVLSFDEILSPEHEARVVLAATLREGGETRLDRTFAASAPIAGADGAATAESMGRALDEIVRKVTSAAAATLAAKPPGAPRPK